jgi:acetoin utilization deacetylase AcuC-like enzyme
MILTDPTHLLSLPDFGILIPIRDTRITNTLQFLEKSPLLKNKKWKTEGLALVFNQEDLLRVHDPAYVAKLYGPELEEEIIKTFELLDDQGQYHRYDPSSAKLPLTDLRDKLFTFASGTYLASVMALERGFAFFTGGGMHHGHYDHGSGFCLINDIIVTIKKLQNEGLIQGAWVIDIDAHKGDGTAALAQGDPSIQTLSIHMGDGWPLDPLTTEKGGLNNPALIPSDVEIPMREGEDDLYLPRLKKGLEDLALFPSPDFTIVVGGSDPYIKDELPSTQTLQLSLEQMLQRDRMVYDFLKARGIPFAWLMAGGYGDSVWEVYAQFLQDILPEELAE